MQALFSLYQSRNCHFQKKSPSPKHVNAYDSEIFRVFCDVFHTRRYNKTSPFSRRGTAANRPPLRRRSRAPPLLLAWDMFSFAFGTADSAPSATAAACAFSSASRNRYRCGDNSRCYYE